MSDARLSGVRGVAIGLEGNACFLGFCNGNGVASIPFLSINMEGKRTVTWVLSESCYSESGTRNATHLADDMGVLQAHLVCDKREPAYCPFALFFAGDVMVLDAR